MLASLLHAVHECQLASSMLQGTPDRACVFIRTLQSSMSLMRFTGKVCHAVHLQRAEVTKGHRSVQYMCSFLQENPQKFAWLTM